MTEGGDERAMAVKEKTWVVRVEKNPEYCGVGAGGIQFANGKAVIKSARMAKWFMEHEGYKVEEIKGGGSDGGES